MDAGKGMVLCGTRSGELFALSARTGAIQWQHKTRGAIRSRPALSEGSVFVGSSDGCLYRLDARTGRPVWKAPFCTDAAIYGDVVVSDGMVYFTVNIDKIYAISSEDGRFVWEYHRDRPSGMSIEGVASPTLEGDRIYTGFSDGSLVALEARTGKVLWTVALAAAGQHAQVDVDTTPVIEGNTLYAAAFPAGPVALRATDGAVLWRGTWTGSTPPVVQDERLLFSTADGDVVGVRRSDGLPLFTTRLTKTAPSTPLVVGDLLLVAGDRGIWALGLGDGAPLSLLAVPMGVREVTAAWERRMFFVGGGGLIHAADIHVR